MTAAPGKRVVSGEAPKDRVARLVLGYEDEVNSAAFSPDGRRVVTGCRDKTARIWDVASGKIIGELLKGHISSVLYVAFSHDGRRIVAASGDKTARIWDAANWASLMRSVDWGNTQGSPPLLATMAHHGSG